MQRAVDGLRTVELLLSANDKLPALDPSLLEVVQNDKSTRARIRLAALLTPFRWILFEEKKKKIPLVDSVIRDGLKLGSMNFYLNGIPPLFKGAELIRKGCPDPLTTGSRAQIGILLRNTSIHYPVVGAEWSSSLFFALVQEVVDCWSDEGLDEAKASEYIQRYNSLAETIQRYNLAESIKAPPIIDGKIVCHTLNIRPGPHMGLIMDRIIHWQLENPDKDVGDCEAWLKEEGTKGTFGPLPPASRGVGEGSSKKKGR
ncbi:CCA tRNA nucleotidyltransferase, mitochondrial [Serendipita sp. 411]|nr:CCA tRNA nucleotidyltransferase, mitochondrial [Serendipita sp. 411]